MICDMCVHGMCVHGMCVHGMCVHGMCVCIICDICICVYGHILVVIPWYVCGCGCGCLYVRIVWMCGCVDVWMMCG